MPRNRSIERPRRGAVIVTLVLALVMAPFAALAEPAEPDTPTTSADAQQRWLDASRAAATLNEQVLQAHETLTVATATSTAAAQSVTEASSEVDAATAAAAVCRRRAGQTAAAG